MARKRPAVNHEVMQQMNRALILDSLRKQPSQTRSKLADRMGLTRSAMSNLTDDLIREEMIHEVGFEKSTGGRRGILLELNPDGGGVIALKFNESSVQCALVNLVGEIVWHEFLPVEDTDETVVLDLCRQQIDKALQKNGGARPILGIGVAAPGLISDDGDMIYSKFMDWRNVSFRRDWEADYGVPVSVDNMVSLAALGESRYGSATDDSHFFYVEIGYGAGAGIVINHQLYQGRHGLAGEIGYMQAATLSLGGWRATDWQELVNIPNFLKLTRRLIDSGCQTSLDSTKLDFPTLLVALRDGDPAACWALSQIGLYLGIGFASLYNVLDISVFILGGELGREFASSLNVIHQEMQQFLIAQPPDGFDLRISGMRPDAALIGAAARVFDTVLIEPSLSVRI